MEHRRLSPKRHVLIAESDVALAELYRAALEADGWKVEIVIDARAAMGRVKASPPQVLVLNNLADGSVVDLVRKVRSLPSTNDTVIVVLMDTVDRMNVQDLEKLDVQAWLSKTRMTREKLSETIAALVANRASDKPERDRP